jgi:hypothetical protein
MSEVRWAFLSNHGRVFCYLAKHPKSTIEGLARDAGLSVAGVHRIIDDLEEGGYIARHRVGRCNHYTVHPELPMRHHLEWDHNVVDILLAIGGLQAVEKDAYGEKHETTSRVLRWGQKIPVPGH